MSLKANFLRIQHFETTVDSWFYLRDERCRSAWSFARQNSGCIMTESDKTAVENALQTNPLAIAEAEGHLKRGLTILGRELGLGTTRNIVSAVLSRLEEELPSQRTH